MIGTDRHAVPHTIVVVEVEGFGSPDRTLPHQFAIRGALYEMVADALAAAGVAWDDCYYEDRGDGVFVLVPPEFPKAPLIEVMPRALVRALREHNASSSENTRTRLRLAVHAGEVVLDERGVTPLSPTTLTTAFRLLDAPPLKAALAGSPGVLAIIVSQSAFDDAVRHSTVLDPATFRPVEVENKDMADLAWIALPDHPYRSDPAMLAKRPPGPASLHTPSDSRAVAGTHADIGPNRTDEKGVASDSVHVTGGTDAPRSGVTIGTITGDQITIRPPSQEGGGVSLSSDPAVGHIVGGFHTRKNPTRPLAPTPRQLDPIPQGFLGRDQWLATLTRTYALDEEGRHASGGLAVIYAPGGMGKTWLALTWAHRYLTWFPDGQLAVDLRGSDADESKAALDVLADFLAVLGVDHDHQPAGLEARTMLFRALTTGKRMLILLDNAANVDQVVPLLPGGSTCHVVITTRYKLTPLLIDHGAVRLHLDVLTDIEACTMLTLALDTAHRTPDAEGKVSGLIGPHGGVPLTLGLIAARLRNRPDVLDGLITELHAIGRDALHTVASLPNILSWTLRHLTERERITFALLGAAPGPDVDLAAAASLTALPEPELHAALRALVEAALLVRAPDGRYTMHDMIRPYAQESSQAPAQAEAMERIVDFYLHTAHSANRLLQPHSEPISLDPPDPGVHAYQPANRREALAWLSTYHPHLLAAQRTAANLGRHHAVWHLAWNLETFYNLRGYRREALDVWLAALDAAAQLSDPATLIRTHRILSRSYSRLGVHERALRHLEQALDLGERHQVPTEQAHTHRELAAAWERKGNDQRAWDHARHALDLYRRLGQPALEAQALTQMGWHAARLGELDAARFHLHAAIILHRIHQNPTGEGTTLAGLGYTANRAGDHQRALDLYHQALTLLRPLGRADQVADILDNMGHPHVALGRHGQAQAAWREALKLYRDQGHAADADRVQQQLESTSRPGDVDEAEPVTVYTSGNDGTPVRDAVVNLLEAAGFAITTSHSPQRGSWFQRLSARQKEPDAAALLAAAVSNGVNSNNVSNVVQSGIISSVQIHATDTPREERIANAIARLMEACRGHEEVIVYMPPVLVVKIGAMLTAWEPTYDERRVIDANPALLHSPHKLLAAMTALRADGQAS